MGNFDYVYLQFYDGLEFYSTYDGTYLSSQDQDESFEAFVNDSVIQAAVGISTTAGSSEQLACAHQAENGDRFVAFAIAATTPLSTFQAAWSRKYDFDDDWFAVDRCNFNYDTSMSSRCVAKEIEVNFGLPFYYCG